MGKIRIDKIMKNGRAIFLAYDQGLEHGPQSDFNDKNVNPNYVIEIAKMGKFNAFICQKGIAEKYKKEIEKSKIPLIIKLNGKTNLNKGEPISSQICGVKEAVDLGASAVGFTIYIGSQYESQMIEEFSKIESEAHALGLPMILWVYPRGRDIKNDVSRENISYAARTGLELGADIVKLKYGGNLDDLKWAIKSAGRTKVVVAGGMKTDEKLFLQNIAGIMKAGASGIAVGRNVWQSENPVALTKKIKKIVFKK